MKQKRTLSSSDDNNAAVHEALEQKVSFEDLRVQILTLLSEELWEQAETYICQLPDPQEKSDAFASLAKALIKQQLWTKAEQAINQISIIDIRLLVIYTLLDALLQCTQVKRMHNIVQAFINADLDDRLFNSYFDQRIHSLIIAQSWDQIENLLALPLDDLDIDWLRSTLIEDLVQEQYWENAENQIELVKDRTSKRYLESLLIGTMIQKELWVQVEETISRIRDSKRKASYESSLAIAYGERGNWEQAHSTALRIESKVRCESTLLQLVENMVNTCQMEKSVVIAIIEEITIPRYRRNAISTLRRDPSTQEWVVEEVVPKIKEKDEQNKTLSTISHNHAKNQRWDEARNAIGRIDDKNERVKAIRELGEDLTKAQEQEKLLSLIQWAWSEAETRDEIFELFRLVSGLPSLLSEQSADFQNAVKWVDDFLRG